MILSSDNIGKLEKYMKSIKIESQMFASRVTSFFQHPTHYIAIVQTQKQQVNLYDQKTMSIIGVSNKNYSQMIKCVAFTEDINVTYAYFEGKLNLRSSTYNPYFVRMELKDDGILYCHNIFILNENFKPQEGFLSMAYLNNRQNYQNPIFAFLNSSSCYFITLKGQIVKKSPISTANRETPNFHAEKCIYVNNGEFLVSFKQFLFVNKIKGYQGTLRKLIKFEEQIQLIFIDSTLTQRYISVVTKDQTIHILSRSSKQVYVKSSIGLSYFKPTVIDFFYFSPNSSSTNKFKNLVFLLFQGATTSKKQKKLTNEQTNQSQLRSSLSNSSSFCSKSLYIYSFEEIHDVNNEDQSKQLILKQSNIFFMKNIGTIKGLFNNCHLLNNIIVLSHQNQLVSYDLRNIFNQKVDQKWIYWIYRYQATKKHGLEYYQQQANDFQKDLKKYKSSNFCYLDRSLPLNYLDDWSLSCLSKQMLINLKTVRLKGLEF